MRHLKMLGVAALMAAALTAVIGAGTASATTLCKENVSACPTASMYSTGSTFHATLKTSTTATLAAGFSTISCTESTVHIITSSTGGSSGTPVTGTIAGLSFGSCGTATVKVLKLGSGAVNWTSGVSGNLTGSGTEVEIAVGTTKCFYGGEIKSGLTVTGGAPATGKATNVELVRQTGSSALCANPAKWNAEYVFDGETSKAYVTNS
jgi:hypothetical protein